MRSIPMKVITAAAILMIVATFFFSAAAPATNVYASDPYMDKTIPTSGMTNKDIEYMNQHEIAWMTSQNSVFNSALQLEPPFQKLIDSMVKKHGPAPTLDIALGTYDTSLIAAQKVQLEAAKTIGAQSGFDVQGHVKNRDWALQTVTNGRESLRNARLQLLDAIHKLHRSYAAWHNLLINHVQ